MTIFLIRQIFWGFFWSTEQTIDKKSRMDDSLGMTLGRKSQRDDSLGMTLGRKSRMDDSLVVERPPFLAARKRVPLEKIRKFRAV